MAIVKIQHKGLKELFDTGRTAKISKAHHENICDILDFLNAIGDIGDCVGQYQFHPLKGARKRQYAMSVSGNYRICFSWDGSNVCVLSYEDYH